jgi:hypothetical protein
MRTKFLVRFVGVMTLGLVAFSSLDAQAAPVIQTFTCSQGIQDIIWDGGALYIDCIGQPNRFAAFSFSPCTGLAGNMDNVKIFQGLATSAMLSGKQLQISYATPASCQGTVGAITSLLLNR